MKYLIIQAMFLPLFFFVPVTIAGMLVEDYSPIRQHGSAISLSENPTAINLLNTGAILSGVSCLLFALGLGLKTAAKNLLSIALLILFGLSMVFNGLYPMGNPMHGLYGIGMSLAILPFAACYEFKGTLINERFFGVSITCGIIISIYFWALMVGLDPASYRGLTQRAACVVAFGWLAYMAWEISRMPQTVEE